MNTPSIRLPRVVGGCGGGGCGGGGCGQGGCSGCGGCGCGEGSVVCFDCCGG